MTSRLQNCFNWVVVASQLGHLFCCGIPILFSVLGLLSTIGVVVSMPFGVDCLHCVMHDYETHILVASAGILTLGWALHYVAMRMDCRSTGCGHEPCAPKKRKASKILMLATAIFAFNLLGHFFFHG